MRSFFAESVYDLDGKKAKDQTFPWESFVKELYGRFFAEKECNQFF